MDVLENILKIQILLQTSGISFEISTYFSWPEMTVFFDIVCLEKLK